MIRLTKNKDTDPTAGMTEKADLQMHLIFEHNSGFSLF